MTKKLQTSKSEQWIKQGAPEQALSFLGEAVTKLNDIAVEKQIVFKGNDEMENNVEEVKTEAIATETVVIETQEPEKTVTKETQEPNALEVIQKGISDAIVIALKEYNDSVVAPLQAQIAELKASMVTAPAKVEKSFSFENVFIGANEFMPAAAVAEMIKKEFNLAGQTEQKGDVVVKDIEKVETVVVKKEIAPTVDKSNVLAGF